jgi:anti-sigma factor RsiW
MLTNHITSSLDAYLDNRLTAEERHSIEVDLAICPACPGASTPPVVWPMN